jgi:PAS domain S-box-containing protein
MGQRTVRELLHSRAIGVALLAALYLVAARFGLAFGVVEQVTAIWPPSGLALAALFLGGSALWPGVWLGAFAANLLADEPLGTVLGIATGNTLEALLGVWLLRRAAFDGALERLRDVLALLLAAACSTVPAALLGVASPCLGGLHPWSKFGLLAGTWWWGDAMGIVLVAIPLFAWSAGVRVLWQPRRALELAALLLGLVWTSVSIFGEHPQGGPNSLRYVAYPFVIWAAIRFGQRGVSVAVLTTSVITAWATFRGLGPFGAADFESRWLALQVFTAILAITGALLGAAIGERDRTGRQRLAEFAVARILAQETDLAAATRRVVESVCATLDFDVGAWWTVDARERVLRCVEFWQREALEVPEFAALTRRSTFAPGVGLPGRVWSSGAPAWIEDVVRDADLPRTAAASAEGLHGAFAFPVLVDGEVLGVLELFSRRRRGPDLGLLHSLASIGSHFGHFIRRKSAEDAVRASETRKAGVLASVMDAIVTIDHQGRLLEFNPGAERMFGIKAAGALGRDLAELIVPHRHRDGHRRGLARVVETGRSELVDTSMYMSALRADGSEFPVELTITRVAGAHPPLFTGFVRDITERRRAEAERSQLLELERHARAEAEALAAHLRQEKEAKDRFLALLGHELRNPLAPISNALHVLRASGAASPDAPRLYRLMERQVRHMARLVDDLLDVSRIARGTIEMRFEPMDLVALVEGVVEAGRPLLDERRHRLRCSSLPLRCA